MKRNFAVLMALVSSVILFSSVVCAGCGSSGKLFLKTYKDDRAVSFIKNFDPENIEYVEYFDMDGEWDTDDKEIIAELFDGLSQIKVTGKGDGSLFALDAAWPSVNFVTNDGYRFSAYFSGGSASPGSEGESYLCEDMDSFNEALDELFRASYSGTYFEVCTDEDVIAFSETFDPENAAALTYQFGDEKPFETDDKNIIGSVFHDLYYLSIYTPYRGDRADIDGMDSCERICFAMNDGTSVEITFEAGYADIDGVLYRCSFDQGLKYDLEGLRN